MGELQDTEIDLEVIFCIEKFCGGSSGAETQRKMIFIHAVNITDGILYTVTYVLSSTSY